jgi:hypothetical protein
MVTNTPAADAARAVAKVEKELPEKVVQMVQESVLPPPLPKTPSYLEKELRSAKKKLSSPSVEEVKIPEDTYRPVEPSAQKPMFGEEVEKRYVSRFAGTTQSIVPTEMPVVDFDIVALPSVPYMDVSFAQIGRDLLKLGKLFSFPKRQSTSNGTSPPVRAGAGVPGTGAQETMV